MSRACPEILPQTPQIADHDIDISCFVHFKKVEWHIDPSVLKATFFHCGLNLAGWLQRFVCGIDFFHVLYFPEGWTISFMAYNKAIEHRYMISLLIKHLFLLLSGFKSLHSLRPEGKVNLMTLFPTRRNQPSQGRDGVAMTPIKENAYGWSWEDTAFGICGEYAKLQESNWIS